MTDASWVETQLGKVCTLEKRAVHPSRLGPTLVNHFSLPAFDLGKNPERVSAVEIKSNKLEVLPRSVLVSKLNPQTPRIWEPKVSNEEINVCSTEFAVLLPNESLYPGFLRYWIESEPVYSKVEELANGTSSSHQRVNLDDMMKISALLPPREIQEKITKLLSLFDQKIESRLRSESNILEIGDLMLSQLKQDGETRNVTVNELAEFHNKKRQPLSRLERDKRPGIYRYFGATSIFGYVDDYLFDGTFLLIGEDGSVINSDGTAVMQLVEGKFWVNNHAHVLTGKSVSTGVLFFMLRDLQVDMAVTGAVQPKLSMGRFQALEVEVPLELSKFTVFADIALHQVSAWRSEVQRLKTLRDFLLAKFINNEVSIADNGNPEIAL